MADLAFDPTSGVLYGVGTNGGAHLYSINTTTGAATLIGDSGLAFTNGGGVEIDSTGAVFGSPLPANFGTYDKVTGLYTDIANPAKPTGRGYGALSFNGNKIVTTGGGGAVITGSAELARAARHLTTTARLASGWEFVHDAVGYNYRLPSLNAALGLAQLELLPVLLARKQSLAARYIREFAQFRGARMFDRIIVAILVNAEKSPMFSMQERVEIAREVFKPHPKVEVDTFNGLLVDYVERKQAQVIVRGLRAVSDFEFEFQMALMNRRLDPKLETIFLTPQEEFTFLSSRIVKEVAKLGGDVTAFVPPPVAAALREKFRK